MGMQTTQIQSPQTNRPMGKGSFQHSDGLPHGDYGDPNFGGSNVENMPAELAPFGRNVAQVGGMNGRPQQATQGLGKGSSNSSTPFAQGGNVTYPGQGGQPQMGKPNQYSNTLSPWDNATIAPQYSAGGKGGKSGGMQGNYPTARTNWSYSLPGSMTQPQQTTSNASNVDYGGY